MWAAAWQNQQNDLCALRRLRSAWASAQSYLMFIFRYRNPGGCRDRWPTKIQGQRWWCLGLQLAKVRYAYTLLNVGVRSDTFYHESQVHLGTSHLLPGVCGGSGGGYIQGCRIFLSDVLGGGVKIKSPWGRGGCHIFHQVFWGSDVLHWFLLSFKVKTSPPPPTHTHTW